MTTSEPVNLLICSGNTETEALVDSESVCTIRNKSLTNAVVLNSQENHWVESTESLDLKFFSNELIKTIGVINTSFERNNQAAENVNFAVDEDGQRPIIGRDLFPSLAFPNSS